MTHRLRQLTYVLTMLTLASRLCCHAGVAQTAEQLTRNEQAKGSSPFSGSQASWPAHSARAAEQPEHDWVQLLTCAGPGAGCSGTRRTIRSGGSIGDAEESPFIRNALERVRSSVREMQPRPDDKILHGAAHEDLARRSQRGDAGSDVDREAGNTTTYGGTRSTR